MSKQTESKKKTESKKRSREEPQQPEQNYSLPKRLAHNEKRVRDAAIAALSQWLNKDEISELEMMKLWKGLFYCFWMSDKPAVQEELAINMANLILSLQPERAMLYLDCFYKTIRREWERIDRLRMDKYMQLVRKFVFASFQWLQRCEWDVLMVVCVAATMGTELNEAKYRGVLMHIVDVLLSELAHIHEEGGEPITALGLHHLLSPFYMLMQASRDATVLKRVQEGVFEALIAIAAGEETHVLYPMVVAMLPTMNHKIFSLASDPALPDSQRNRLYAIRAACKKQMVRLKLDESDIMDDSVEANEGDDEGDDEGDEGDIDDSEMNDVESEDLRTSAATRTNTSRQPISSEDDEPPTLVPITSHTKPAPVPTPASAPSKTKTRTAVQSPATNKLASPTTKKVSPPTTPITTTTTSTTQSKQKKAKNSPAAVLASPTSGQGTPKAQEKSSKAAPSSQTTPKSSTPSNTDSNPSNGKSKKAQKAAVASPANQVKTSVASSPANQVKTTPKGASLKTPVPSPVNQVKASSSASNDSNGKVKKAKKMSVVSSPANQTKTIPVPSPANQVKASAATRPVQAKDLAKPSPKQTRSQAAAKRQKATDFF